MSIVEEVTEALPVARTVDLRSATCARRVAYNKRARPGAQRECRRRIGAREAVPAGAREDCADGDDNRDRIDARCCGS
jgi:hypothetical protein